MASGKSRKGFVDMCGQFLTRLVRTRFNSQLKRTSCARRLAVVRQLCEPQHETTNKDRSLVYFRAGLLTLGALYCFAGAVMNGSFAAGAPADSERYSSAAELL